jgi:tRNA pseudouridine55 synthase
MSEAGRPASAGPLTAATKPAPYLGDGGFLLLDKPAGVSSFQALRPVKRLFPKAKVGHAGTLDPAATGLLIAGVAGGTRLLEYLEGMPKTYAFTAHFGLVSDTYDLEGRLGPFAGTRPAASLTAEEIEAALRAFRGRIRQAPPAYSAVKVGGERAYALARAGEEVILPEREVEIVSLALKAFHPADAGERLPNGSDAAATDRSPVAAAPSRPEGAPSDPASPGPAALAAAPRADFVMTCSKGTYVRSLVHDLGRALGCGAVTGALRRLAIGPFSVSGAQAPEALAGASLLPLETAVSALPEVVIVPENEGRFLNGQTVTVALPDGSPVDADPDGSEVRAHAADGRLLAIALLAPGGRCSPRKVLARKEAA